MSIQSLADHSVKWAQIRGGDGHLWVTGLRLCEFRDCVCVCACAHQCPVSAPCAGSSSGLTMLSVCLRVITPFWHLPPTLLPSPFSCPFLSPSLRFSLAPHLSHCQALVHSTSPLAPWPGLPSNNFISFPPLSRRPAPPLTIGCCFFFFFPSEKRRKKKKAQGYMGQVENPTKADSVLDTGQWYWWLQWGCMDQRSHTKDLPVSAHAELESRGHIRLNLDILKRRESKRLCHETFPKKWLTESFLHTFFLQYA